MDENQISSALKISNTSKIDQKNKTITTITEDQNASKRSKYTEISEKLDKE